MFRGQDVVQFVECLSAMQSSELYFQVPHKLRVVLHTYYFSTCIVGILGSEVQSHVWIHRELKASLGRLHETWFQNETEICLYNQILFSPKKE